MLTKITKVKEKLLSKMQCMTRNVDSIIKGCVNVMYDVACNTLSSSLQHHLLHHDIHITTNGTVWTRLPHEGWRTARFPAKNPDRGCKADQAESPPSTTVGTPPCDVDGQEASRRSRLAERLSTPKKGGGAERARGQGVANEKERRAGRDPEQTC